MEQSGQLPTKMGFITDDDITVCSPPIRRAFINLSTTKIDPTFIKLIPQGYGITLPGDSAIASCSVLTIAMTDPTTFSRWTTSSS